MIRRFLLLLVAAAGPLAFPLAEIGVASLDRLAYLLILPSAVVLFTSWALLRRRGDTELATLLSRGAMGGVVGTLALEAVRYSGFRLGFMPGNLPRLMGVLLLDRFALGPSTASDLAGFAYHFWNGACFGIIFTLLAGRHSRWWAVPYGLGVGLGFLASPVAQALGVGLFGRDFGWHFSATVLTAHAAYGAALAYLCGEHPVRSAAPRYKSAVPR